MPVRPAPVLHRPALILGTLTALSAALFGLALYRAWSPVVQAGLGVALMLSLVVFTFILIIRSMVAFR